MAVLADTGFLLALLDCDDKHHQEAQEALEKERGPFVVPASVLPEVCYLAQKYLGPEAEVRFLRSLSEGEMPLDRGAPEDLPRIVAILKDRPELGYVDASLIATAERLDIKRLATLDRRHFGGFRPAHCAAFELLP